VHLVGFIIKKSDYVIKTDKSTKVCESILETLYKSFVFRPIIRPWVEDGQSGQNMQQVYTMCIIYFHTLMCICRVWYHI